MGTVFSLDIEAASSPQERLRTISNKSHASADEVCSILPTPLIVMLLLASVSPHILMTLPFVLLVFLKASKSKTSSIVHAEIAFVKIKVWSKLAQQPATVSSWQDTEMEDSPSYLQSSREAFRQCFIKDFVACRLHTHSQAKVHALINLRPLLRLPRHTMPTRLISRPLTGESDTRCFILAHSKWF